MLLILDTCDIALGKEPSGGVTFSFKNIEGLPGISLMIPITGESADSMYEGIGKILEKPKIYGPGDMPHG